MQQVVADDDPILNTYGALAVPWLTPDGSLIVSLSRNARDMRRDAYPVPERYRPTFLTMAFPSAAAAAAAASRHAAADAGRHPRAAGEPPLAASEPGASARRSICDNNAPPTARWCHTSPDGRERRRPATMTAPATPSWT